MAATKSPQAKRAPSRTGRAASRPASAKAAKPAAAKAGAKAVKPKPARPIAPPAPSPRAPDAIPTAPRLTTRELEALGGAFAHGYDGVRARRLFQPGLGATAADDLALALGLPMLVELGPDVADPGAYSRDRIARPLRRLEPWPRNAAARAARAIARGWVKFPAQLKPESEQALADGAPIAPAEVATLLAKRFAVIPAAWRHMLDLIFLLEALAGGEAVLAACLGEIEANLAAWSSVDMTRHSVVVALGVMAERLPPTAAAPVRARFAALLAHYRREDPTLADPDGEQVPLRAFDLILDGAVAYARSALRDKDGPDKNFCALFLEPRDYGRLTKGKAATYTTPSVQWVVQGGPAEYAQLPDWSKVEAQGSKEESQRYFVRQWGRVALPGSARLLADMYLRSAVKDDVVAMARRGAARLAPLLDALAADGSQPDRLRKAARALATDARAA